MSLIGDHPEVQWSCGDQPTPSHQRSENLSQQFRWLLHWCNSNILSVRRYILSWRGIMNLILHGWHPTRSLIAQFNQWILLPMNIFISERMQTKPGKQSVHGQLETSWVMNPLLTTWQATLSAQIWTPRQLFQPFWLWSRNVEWLQRIIMGWFWIPLPQMR